MNTWPKLSEAFRLGQLSRRDFLSAAAAIGALSAASSFLDVSPARGGDAEEGRHAASGARGRQHDR
ncbi:twin-arginine translocation signal domain-containing protein [Dongia soli]|uniref:twin-arginine translocation signal domain-containing protein n=1 Tax=Dongia soli TaxID=600628 RepID=UPI0036083607